MSQKTFQNLTIPFSLMHSTVRCARGMTQSELAALIGESQWRVSLVESGQHPSIEYVEALQSALGVNFSDKEFQQAVARIAGIAA